MSIFTKITLLFTLSLTLMAAIGYQIDRINTQKYEAILLQKYLHDGRKIFAWMSVLSPGELDRKLTFLKLVKTSPTDASRILLHQPHTFGMFEIIETDSGEYLIHIRYIDDELYLRDTTLQSQQKDDWVLNALVGADIIVLLIIFFIIIRILSPLRSIAASMRHFKGGEYQTRSAIQSNDEIGEVAASYNEMADTIHTLIRSREELLRNVAHELRTPISRGLFVLENMENPKAQEILNHSFKELDRLTDELLTLEKINSTDPLQDQSFTAETLILEALSKLCVVDESIISINIKTNFTIRGDLAYLALALKNLLDNALKYADALPIMLIASPEHEITVSNHGKPLEKPFSSLLKPFTRQESSREVHGYGLGLDIVTQIIDKHGFTLSYDYTDGYHRFIIFFEHK